MDGSAKNIEFRFGWSRLHTASSQSLSQTQLVIESRVDVNLQTDYGVTALMIASALPDLQIVKYLLSIGANKNLRTTKGQAAYDFLIFK